MEARFPKGKVLRLQVGDITRVHADAIVNAANSALAGGGGMDGAIHRAGGPSIMKELDKIRESAGGCPTGSAVATGAGNLPARYVYHAVGPVYGGGRRNEADLLASCYRNCLRMAEEHDLVTISFPSISTGAYGYPIEEAAAIAVRAVSEHLSAENNQVREAVFVLFSQGDCEVYKRALAKVTGQKLE